MVARKMDVRDETRLLAEARREGPWLSGEPYYCVTCGESYEPEACGMEAEGVKRCELEGKGVALTRRRKWERREGR